MTEHAIYPDDLVVGRSRHGKYKFAVVENVAGIEDSDDDSDDSEFADFKASPLERGYVRVTWYPDGRNEVVQESQVQLVDRSCLARDVVRMADGDQLGTAVHTKVTCDVGILGTSKTLKGIKSEDLKPILPLSSEDQVAYGPWLGSIRYTQEMLVLRFSNGARAKLDVEKDGCEQLMDLFPHPSDEGGFSVDLFYPGQYLWGPAKAFDQVQWVSGPEIKFRPKMKYRVLIEQIELYGVKIKWASRAFNDKRPKDVIVKKEDNLKDEPEKKEEGKKESKSADTGSSVDPELDPSKELREINEAEPPPSVVFKDDLKKFHRLSHFWHGHICMGERLRYRLTGDDAEKLNKQKNKNMKKTKRLRLAKRMDQKLLHGTCSSVINMARKSSSSLRNRRQQQQGSAAQHESSESSSENDDSAYDEEDLEDIEDDTSTPLPSSGAGASVIRDPSDIDFNVNSESDLNLMSPTGVKPAILGTLSCRVAGFELDIYLVQETSSIIAKRHFQCNIQNPECSKEVMDNIRARFRVFMKTMLKKNRDLVNVNSCASVLSQCPHAIRKFIMQQSSLTNQEILFEYTVGGKRTSGVIDKDGQKTEVEYSDEAAEAMELVEDVFNEEENMEDSVDPINDFVLTSGPPSKRQAGPNVQYHAGQWVTVEVTRTHTSVNVQWQDGTFDSGIQSSKLFPAHHVDDNDFCPGDFVIDKRISEEIGDYGVILQADSKNRMTKIQWIREGRVSDIEEVSAYEVADHPDFRFRISDVIVRVGTEYCDDSPENVDVSKQGIGELLKVTDLGMLEVLWMDGSISTVHPMDIIAFGDEEESLFDSSEEVDDFDSDASWETASSDEEGNPPHDATSRDAIDSDASLTGDTGVPRPVKNGIDSIDISHERGEGSHEPNHPHEPEGQSEAHEHHDDSDNIPNENTEHHSEENTPNQNMEEGNHDDHPHEEVAHVEASREPDDLDSGSSQSRDQAVEDSAHGHHDDVNLAHGHHDDADSVHGHHEYVDSAHGHHDDVAHENHRDEQTNEDRTGSPKEAKSETSTKSSYEASDDIVEDEQSVAQISSASSSLASLPGTSENSGFSMVTAVPSSHQFIKRWFQETSSKTFIKAVQRDLKLLRTSLSSGITVKAYEDRMDLLSVLITGPDRTPYQDGIFLFDVYLPQDYPTSPPSVHYVSYSPRLNPNLYETGRVCVSLLGTWSGKGSERWTKDSTLLQVLLSIQGLILNSEPYYNEAGYEGHRGTAEGVKNSRCYNEMVILRLVQHMTSMIRNPPEAFMEEVATFCGEHVPLLISRVSGLLDDVKTEESDESAKHDNTQTKDGEDASSTGYPLLPLSKGVMLSLSGRLRELQAAAKILGYVDTVE